MAGTCLLVQVHFRVGERKLDLLNTALEFVDLAHGLAAAKDIVFESLRHIWRRQLGPKEALLLSKDCELATLLLGELLDPDSPKLRLDLFGV